MFYLSETIDGMEHEMETDTLETAMVPVSCFSYLPQKLSNCFYSFYDLLSFK